MNESWWSSGPIVPYLDGNSIHVWALSLERSDSARADLWQLLAPEERDVAGRFRADVHRHRFICARGLLRRLLTRYTGVPPAELIFTKNEYGKPFLSSPFARIHFNLTHSAGLALCAVARRPVGVDLELIRRDRDYAPLALRFFHRQEIAELDWLDDVGRQRAFFQIWTRKEAYIKARGRGLTIPLDSFDASAAPSKRFSLLTIVAADGSRDWAVQALVPATGFVGAVATKGDEWRSQCWTWVDDDQERIGSQTGYPGHDTAPTRG